MIKLWLKLFGLTVKVSAEDIKNGQRPLSFIEDRAKTCAIARALQRKFKTGDAAWGYSCGHADKLLFSVSDRDAQTVSSFVIAHDSKKQVQPFRFKIVPA